MNGIRFLPIFFILLETTGQPKGVLRPIAGHIVALTWDYEETFYDVNPGEVFWAASDVGWIVGHSYICYAPLFNGKYDSRI